MSRVEIAIGLVSLVQLIASLGLLIALVLRAFDKVGGRAPAVWFMITISAILAKALISTDIPWLVWGPFFWLSASGVAAAARTDMFSLPAWFTVTRKKNGGPQA